MEEQSLQHNPPVDGAAPEVPAAAGEEAARAARERALQDYIKTVDGLVEDAIERKTLRVLVDVMTYNLGRVVVDYGPDAAGHVLERLGVHIAFFNERNRAEKEAKEAREAGRLPH